jgi:hypothetical protein
MIYLSAKAKLEGLFTVLLAKWGLYMRISPLQVVVILRTSKGCFNFRQGKISFSRTCMLHQTRDCVGKLFRKQLPQTIAMVKDFA